MTLSAGLALEDSAYLELLRDAAFRCFKWDTRRGDARALAAYPLVLPAKTWTGLAQAAEALACEALAAEAELLRLPELQHELGLTRWLIRVLAEGDHNVRSTDARYMRFDFHPCKEGFRVSEGNIDVASGFIEASGVTALMARYYPENVPTGDPAGQLAAALSRRLAPEAVVGLLYLSAFSDDRQVMLYLAARLRAAGLRPELLDPADLCWRGCRAVAASDSARPFDAIFRFLPAEWLGRLPARSEVWRFALGDHTPVVNPLRAVLTQSKRLAMLLGRLSVPTPTWRALVPETSDPASVPWASNDEWVLKPALAHEGDRVTIHGVTPLARLQAVERAVGHHARGWAAQRRFGAVAIDTPDGPRYPCVGVYVIDGVACGAYGRIAPRPLIDGTAEDVVVLRGRE